MSYKRSSHCKVGQNRDHLLCAAWCQYKYMQVSESQVQKEEHHIRSALKYVQLFLQGNAV